MNPRVVTYFEPLFEATAHEEEGLLREWVVNWRDAGWAPVTTGRTLAQAHPRYRELLEAVSALPTVNDRRYEEACWIRWLAFSWWLEWYPRDKGVSCLFIDYDVAATQPIEPPSSPCWLALGHDPGCFADKPMLDTIIDAIIKRGKEGIIEIDGKPHVSDMTLLNKIGHEIAPNIAICSPYPSTSTPLVHVSNGSVIAHGNGKTKLQIFRELSSKLTP